MGVPYWLGGIMKKRALWIAPAILMATLVSTQAANLVVNGDFETSNNGFSTTVTPVGWTNVGHSDGVIPYATFATPAYDGLFYYDLGGFGGSLPASGDGIEQTIATSIGTTYNLVFGLTGENGVDSGELLNVLINGTLLQSFVTPFNGGFGDFQNPFATQTLSFTATSASSTITFTVTGDTLGNNDPLLDAISVDSGVGGAVPEPGTWVTCLAGLGLAAFRYRKSVRG
jgi:hypothetical protein